MDLGDLIQFSLMLVPAKLEKYVALCVCFDDRLWTVGKMSIRNISSRGSTSASHHGSKQLFGGPPQWLVGGTAESALLHSRSIHAEKNDFIKYVLKRCFGTNKNWYHFEERATALLF